MTKQISKTQEAYNTMRKVPLVINAVGSGHSLISQVTLEGSRCSFENAKWYVLESPLRQTQSRNGFVDDFCSSKPMQKPVRQESSGKLLGHSILREKDFCSSMTNAVFDSDINVKKSLDLGYWTWHDTDSPQDLTMMMPLRKSSVQDKLNLPSMPLMMPQRKSSVQDKLNLSQHERRTGSRLSITNVFTIFPGT
jgi:hypothetical protein